MKNAPRILTVLAFAFGLWGTPALAQVAGEGGVARALCKWAPDALIDSFSLGHEDFTEDLTDAEIYFTDTGKPAFDQIALNSQVISTMLSTPESVLTVEYPGGAQIVKAEGIDQWFMSVPLNLSLAMPDQAATTATDLREEIVLDISIWDLPASEQRRDYAIMSMAARPQTEAELDPRELLTPELESCR